MECSCCRGGSTTPWREVGRDGGCDERGCGDGKEVSWGERVIVIVKARV